MTLNAKLQCRNDSLFNWELNKDYIPLKGEICFYNDKINLQKRNQNGETISLPDFKIGDGSSTIENLPFFGEETLNNLIISPEKTSFIAPSFTTYTNYLPLSTDASGKVYNGQGWKANTRLNSKGKEVEQEGVYTTGFIPAALGDVIYLDNITWNNSPNNENTLKDYMYFTIYDKNKNMLYSAPVGFLDPTNNAVVYEEGSEEIYGTGGNVIQINTANAVYAYSGEGTDWDPLPDWRNENMAYFRISCQYIGEDSIITVNEEITQEIAGLSLIPEIAVPMAVSNQKRITALEQNSSTNNGTSTDSTVPAYVTLEAEDVIQRVISAQGSRTFTFAALTDLHYGNGGYTDSVLHASQALNYIDSRIKLDAVMVLGDYTDDDDDNADFRAVNNLLNNVRFAPNLRQQGNHDFNGETNPIVFRHIQAYSDDVVWGDRIRGYYYKDFNDYKLRVISINTTDIPDDGGLGLSANQIIWFINSLDMTDKSDAENWQILIISHHPLDWWSANSLVATYILNAYQNGTSWTNGIYSCDYTGKNKAKLIGNIHGHIHNLLADYLRLGNANSTTNTEVWRIATPEGCINRANQYSGVYADAVTYNKTINTAKDTAFCIYCIDLDTYTINAICYGAGYDRQITYYVSEEATYYSVINNLTNVTTTNNVTTVIENGKYSAKYYPNDGYEIISATITIGGVDFTETYYSGGTKQGSLEIADVTGDVVVTIVATAAEAEPAYTNQIPLSVESDGTSLYNGGQGWKTNTRLNGSGVETTLTGWEVTGFIPINPASAKVYFANIDWNGTGENKDYLALYDSSFNVITSTCLLSHWIAEGYGASLLADGDIAQDSNGNVTYINFARFSQVSFGGANASKWPNVAYFRISACGIDNNSIITVDEEIV